MTQCSSAVSTMKHLVSVDVGGLRKVLQCHRLYSSRLEVLKPVLPCKLEGEVALDISTTSADMHLVAIG